MPVTRFTSGFSLTELIVVLSLFAVAAAIAYPALSPLLASSRIESAAQNLATDLQKSRFRAIAENASIRVSFSTGARTYTTCKSNDGGATFTVGCVTKKIDDAGAINIAVSAGPTPTFDNRGRVTLPATITLTTVNGGQQRLVGVSASGYVNVL
jgi:prepilin-type N-terminal cleavage/methylation domain-containing protein